MKNKFLLAAIFCGVSFFTSAQDKKSFKVALIGFYNLENYFDTIDDPLKNDEEFLPNGANRYTAEVYLDKTSKLEEVLSQIGTDISPDGLSMFGCAEIENEVVLKDLCNTPKLKSRNYKIVHYPSPDERSIDVALIYNPKYFTPKSSESLFVDIKNDDGSQRFTRDVLYVAGNYSGELIHVFVNHWPSRRGGEEASAPGRAKAASVVKHKIDSIQLKNPAAKIIVMGDLNDDPVNESVARVIGATGDREKAKGKKMFNPWMRLYKEGLGTLAYNDAWNLFDQILISSQWLDKKQPGFFFKEERIFKKEFMIQQDGKYKGYPFRTYNFNKYQGGYSDHFPTYIVLYKTAK